MKQIASIDGRLFPFNILKMLLFSQVADDGYFF